MKKQKKIEVKWVGPDGEFDQSKNSDLLQLLDHRIIRDKYSKKNIDNLKESTKKALKYLRRLFSTYELVSAYHNVGHNYITAVTVLKGFIGGLKMGRIYSKNDLEVLLIATLFHDTGYLRKSNKQKKTDVFTHSMKSLDFVSTFMDKILGWNGENSPKVKDLQSFTCYADWDENKKKLDDNDFAKILVGSDFMQVVDKNYFQNLEVLREFLRSKNVKNDKKGQARFLELSREVTSYAWEFLDSFFDGKENNPYRKGWDRFEDTMKKDYM